MYIQECLILNTDGSDPILPAQICMMMHWYKCEMMTGLNVTGNDRISTAM